MTSAREIVRQLSLAPHPEGGHYREVYRSTSIVTYPSHAAGQVMGSAKTSIYYLLEAGDFSAWHRVRSADETWHLYTGGPLKLHLISPDGEYSCQLLTANLAEGEPQRTIPAGWWQAARPAPGVDWTLCGCTVAPGFDFANFDMPPLAELLLLFPHLGPELRQLTKR